MVILLADWMRLVMSFNLIPHTWMYSQYFGSYKGFYIYSPFHPWGTPGTQMGQPLTSTPLPPSGVKLNQSRVQIRGQNWPSPSRLGVTAPALLGASFWAQSSGIQMLSFPLRFELLVAWCRWRQLSYGKVFNCSFVCRLSAASPPLPLEEESNMAAPLVAASAARVDVRDWNLLFWFLCFSLK